MSTNTDELVIRHLQRRATAAEEAALHRWRRASPGHEAQFQEIVLVWTSLGDPRLDTSPPAVDVLTRRHPPREVLPIRTAPAARGWRRRATGVAAAAAAAVALLIGTATFLNRAVPAPPLLEALDVSTGPAETRMAQLSDGTLVHLAPNSRLRVFPDRNRRVVSLVGRAFFGVARDADHPFVVRSRLGEAQVLGTRFEFSTLRDRVRVVVVEGRVAFSGAGERVEVGAGQMTTASAGEEPVVEPVPDVDEALLWMGQVLVFNETPLARAAREIEVRYGATIRILDDDLRRVTVSGGFTNQTFESVVSSICRVVAAECSISERSAIISARS